MAACWSPGAPTASPARQPFRQPWWESAIAGEESQRNLPARALRLATAAVFLAPPALGGRAWLAAPGQLTRPAGLPLHLPPCSAAGNSELDLDSSACSVYPACFRYPGLLTVANIQQDGTIHPSK
jgi:hypothetical protein